MEVETATLVVTAETMSQSAETIFHADATDPSPQSATSINEAGTIVEMPKPVK